MRLPMKLPLYLVIFSVIVNCNVFGEEEIICPDSDEIVFLASTKSCSEYYMCFGGSPVVMTCFDDLHFNVMKQSCDLPKIAQCTIPGATLTGGKTSDRPSNPTQSVASSGKTSPTPATLHTRKPSPPAFVPTQQTTTGTTHTSRPLTESTVVPSTEYPSTASPYTSPPLTKSTVLPLNESTANVMVPSLPSDAKKQCEVQVAGYFAYPDDCHYYYRCVNAILSVQVCPWGYGFDVNKKACHFSGCSTQGK